MKRVYVNEKWRQVMHAQRVYE